MLNDFMPVINKLPVADHPNGLTLIPLADAHYGSPEFNEVRWHQTIKRIQDDPDCYCVLVGDLIDNGLKNSITNVYEATCSSEGTKAPRAAITDYVASLLDYGKENAISRKDLAHIIGVSDRQMRKMVEEARRDGLVVCCDQDSKGYYLADTPEEYRRQYWQTYNRAMSLLVQLKGMRERARA